MRDQSDSDSDGGGMADEGKPEEFDYLDSNQVN